MHFFTLFYNRHSKMSSKILSVLSIFPSLNFTSFNLQITFKVEISSKYNYVIYIYFKKFRAKKRRFLYIFTHFSASTHYMLWSNSIFCSPYHNSASESRTPHALNGQRRCQRSIMRP